MFLRLTDRKKQLSDLVHPACWGCYWRMDRYISMTITTRSLTTIVGTSWLTTFGLTNLCKYFTPFIPSSSINLRFPVALVIQLRILRGIVRAPFFYFLWPVTHTCVVDDEDQMGEDFVSSSYHSLLVSSLSAYEYRYRLVSFLTL